MPSASNRSEAETPTPAALAVVLRDAHALLVRRSNRPDAGLWGFPGGKCEAGESPDRTALRELGEETGLIGTGARAIGRLYVRRQGFFYQLDAFLIAEARGTARAADDAEEARWLPLAQVIAGAALMSRDVDRLALRAALMR